MDEKHSRTGLTKAGLASEFVGIGIVQHVY